MTKEEKYYRYTNAFKCCKASSSLYDRSMSMKFCSKYGNHENYRIMVTNKDHFSKRVLYRNIYKMAEDSEIDISTIKQNLFLSNNIINIKNLIKMIYNYAKINVKICFNNIDCSQIFNNIGVSYI